jgi:acetyl esterase/lipase
MWHDAIFQLENLSTNLGAIMKKFFLWAGVIICLVLCAMGILGWSWIWQYQALADDEPEIVLSPDIADITYCTMDGIPLKMDIYYPENSQPDSQVLVYFHGGSFTGGDKQKGSGTIDIPAMTSRGYAVAAVNYRLMPDHAFPAEVLDAKCAIRFLRAHAREFHLRTEKIGIWGGSAGGHLAAMVGLTGGDPYFDGGEYLEQSSQVDAVVAMFGPTDLTMPMSWLQRLILRRAFGTDDPQDELLQKASPVNYVREDAPPFLILQGDKDSAVPLAQAQALNERLAGEGSDVTLVVVQNGNHNFKPTGGAIQPTREEISALMADFFDQRLR